MYDMKKQRVGTKRWGARLAGGLVAVAMLVGSAATALAGEPTDYVKGKSERVVKVLGQKEGPKRREALTEEMREAVDFRELAAQALGAHWEARSPEERQEFLDLLQQMLQINYTKKLRDRRLEREKLKIVWDEEKSRKDRAIVKTRVAYDGGEMRPVEYKLMRRGKDKWVIFDIVTDDISLLETYRESYTKIIDKEGWSGLISRMKRQLEKLEAASEG